MQPSVLPGGRPSVIQPPPAAQPGAPGSWHTPHSVYGYCTPYCCIPGLAPHIWPRSASSLCIRIPRAAWHRVESKSTNERRLEEAHDSAKGSPSGGKRPTRSLHEWFDVVTGCRSLVLENGFVVVSSRPSSVNASWSPWETGHWVLRLKTFGGTRRPRVWRRGGRRRGGLAEAIRQGLASRQHRCENRRQRTRCQPRHRHWYRWTLRHAHMQHQRRCRLHGVASSAARCRGCIVVSASSQWPAIDGERRHAGCR